MNLHHCANCEAEAQAEADPSKFMMKQLGDIGTYTRIDSPAIFVMSFELSMDHCQRGYRVEVWTKNGRAKGETRRRQEARS